MNIGLARLKKEYQLFLKDPPLGVVAEPDPKNWFRWHFVFYDLPAEGPYAGGFYHGELVFPLAYPNAPPDILMHTPSGRFEVETKICTSFSSFHPESWSPSWNVQTILKGIISFFLSDEGGTGTTRASNATKKAFASGSVAFNLKDKAFVELFQAKLEALGKDLTVRAPPCDPSPRSQDAKELLIGAGVLLAVGLAMIGKYLYS